MDLEVYVPPLPASIPELKVRIRTAIETITADMLQTVSKLFSGDRTVYELMWNE